MKPFVFVATFLLKKACPVCLYRYWNPFSGAPLNTTTNGYGLRQTPAARTKAGAAADPRRQLIPSVGKVSSGERRGRGHQYNARVQSGGQGMPIYNGDRCRTRLPSTITSETRRGQWRTGTGSLGACPRQRGIVVALLWVMCLARGIGQTGADTETTPPPPAYACQLNPCFSGVACTSLNSVRMAQSDSAVAFECAACPAGYRGDGVNCTDVDECAGGGNGGELPNLRPRTLTLPHSPLNHEHL